MRASSAALLAALRTARRDDGGMTFGHWPSVVIIDCDLQDPRG